MDLSQIQGLPQGLTVQQNTIGPQGPMWTKEILEQEDKPKTSLTTGIAIILVISIIITVSVSISIALNYTKSTPTITPK